MFKSEVSRYLAGLSCAWLLICGSTPAGVRADPKSGYEYLQPETQEMQDDEFENPGMHTVERGRTIFQAPGKSGESCAACHGEDGEQLDVKGLAGYPVYNEKLAKPVTLRNQIHMCWNERLQNKPMKKYNDKRAIALETFVRHLAHGQPVNVQIDGPMKPFYEAGKAFYAERAGQFDMGCIHCHGYFPGRNLRAQTLSQGQSNGFPTYRLQNTRVNGLHERFRQCQHNFRAKALKAGSEEYVNLEVYINAMGNGLKIETPAVRF